MQKFKQVVFLLFIASCLLCLSCAILNREGHKVVLDYNESHLFNIAANSYRIFPFSVDKDWTNLQLNIVWNTDHDDIDFAVMDQDNFERWQIGIDTVEYIYQVTGTSCDNSISLPSNNSINFFYVLFNNTGNDSVKITSHVDLDYRY